MKRNLKVCSGDMKYNLLFSITLFFGLFLAGPLRAEDSCISQYQGKRLYSWDGQYLSKYQGARLFEWDGEFLSAYQGNRIFEVQVSMPLPILALLAVGML
jgi:hypothetical protein